MKGKNVILVLSVMLLLAVFLIGCRQNIEGNGKISDSMEIVDETQKPAAEELEKEFDDSLDATLQELEEIEGI